MLGLPLGGAGLEAPERRDDVIEFCLLSEFGTWGLESCLLIPARARSAVGACVIPELILPAAPVMLMPESIAATLLRVLVLEEER